MYTAKGDKIRFESENYFFYFNKIKLKDEYRDKTKILELVEAFNSFFEMKVAEVLSISEDGKPTRYYTINNKDLPPDPSHGATMLKMYLNGTESYYSEYIFGWFGKDIREAYKEHYKNDPRADYYQKMMIHIQKTLQNMFDKFFEDNMYPYSKRYFKLISTNYLNDQKFKKKRKIGNQWALAKPSSYGSDIEKILGEALKKKNIPFIQQQEIFNQGILLTVLDFYIESANLAIYCDGFQYHYDKDSVIKDRKQDRTLQLLGYKVLRFTGSEIVGNVDECIWEIKYFIDKFK
ncbi:MAG: endonuclease domain-containing protein [Candidatus Sericytochromatia bacterium]